MQRTHWIMFRELLITFVSLHLGRAAQDSAVPEVGKSINERSPFQPAGAGPDDCEFRAMPRWLDVG